MSRLKLVLDSEDRRPMVTLTCAQCGYTQKIPEEWARPEWHSYVICSTCAATNIRRLRKGED